MRGGTLPYMAPEQIEAFLNPELWGQVGAQADVYSLGLALRELLTGEAPDHPDRRLAPACSMRDVLDRRAQFDPSMRRLDPSISHALDAIVVRCLSFFRKDRYPDARALAEDLERFLKRRRLVHRPSRRERSGSWIDSQCQAFVELDRTVTRRPPFREGKSTPDFPNPNPLRAIRREHPPWDHELDG
jgi:serine/threonine protein kinase